ncbi:hypothetical protein [Streptomyces spongiae]|uniref:hypothetical protein n=1 Tax=Streptomyces spongiae TaxID=565072 RepID=UPI00389A7CBA
MTESGKTAAEVAKELGINETTLTSWASRARQAGTTSAGESDGLERLRREAHLHYVTLDPGRIGCTARATTRRPPLLPHNRVGNTQRWESLSGRSERAQRLRGRSREGVVWARLRVRSW